ncbi:MAG: NAD-dependent epimerase/dehydratase family protein, partial [bacterium]
QGDLQNIGQFADLLKTMHLAVLAAADWGGTHAYFVNVAKTLELLELLDPAVCEQALYFSTSSILDPNNQLLEEAGEIGTDYIRSKYDCFQRLPALAIAPRITVLFPTLVVGGDANSPRSFLSDGLPKLMKWMNLVRFFKGAGSFHLIHGQDIAQIVRYLIEHPPTGTAPRSYVLGQAPLTLDRAVEEVCAYLDKKIYFRVPMPVPLARALLMWSQRNISYRDRFWDRFCLDHRDFTHANPVTPASFGLPNLFPTLTDVLHAAGIPRGASSSLVRRIPQPDGSEDRSS